MHLATGNERLPLHGFDAYQRAWSPDGRRLAEEVLTSNTRTQIVQRSLESRRQLVSALTPFGRDANCAKNSSAGSDQDAGVESRKLFRRRVHKTTAAGDSWTGFDLLFDRVIA